MRSLTRIALVLLLGLTCDCLAQSVQKNKVKSAGAIAGRITLNSKDVAGVRVSAVSENDRYRNRDTEFRQPQTWMGTFVCPICRLVFIGCGRTFQRS